MESIDREHNIVIIGASLSKPHTSHTSWYSRYVYMLLLECVRGVCVCVCVCKGVVCEEVMFLRVVHEGGGV